MRHERGTFTLQEETLERLRAFAGRSGLSQSVIVDGLLIEGLEYLERHWPNDKPLPGVFTKRTAEAGIRKAAKSRQA